MTHSFAKKCFCSFLCISIFFSGYAQTGKENWSLRFGDEGYSFPGSWVPLFLTLKDPIPAGKLEIVRGENTKALTSESWELTHSGQYQFPIFVDEKIPSFTVKIYSSGLLLAEQTFHPTDRLFSGHVIFVNAVPATLRLSLSRMLYPKEPVLVLQVLPQNLPVSALSYDAVTALVLSDPGPVLNPGQISAMGEWIALGGNVILLDPLKGSSSMLEQFNSHFMLTGSGNERQLGLGTVHFVYTDAIDAKTLADSDFWKDKLHIVSISQSHRLRPGVIFGKRFDFFQDESANDPLNTLIMYIVVFWIITLVGCGVFLKRRKLSFAIGIICLLSIFIFFQKSTITKGWNRGISMHIRELRLPQDSGTLASISLYTQDQVDASIFSRKSSPYASDFSFISSNSVAKGKIQFSPIPAITWSHSGAGAEMFVDSSDQRTLRLTGIFPTLSDGIWNKKVVAKLRLVKGSAEWQTPGDNGSWKASDTAPPEIAGDADWILHVSDAAPDLEWLVGTDEIDGNKFAGMKRSGITSLWLMPESKQAQK